MAASKEEIRQRVEEILKIRLAGAEFWEVREYAQAKEWGVSDGQLWRYIQKGDRVLEQTLEKNRDKLMNRHMATRRALFAKAIEVGDLANARAVLADEAKLLGLYPSEKFNLDIKTQGDKPAKEMTDDELDAILARGPQ